MENIPPYVQASKYRIIPNITCMKEKFCIAGFDTTDRPRSILTAFACYALKNPHCNATVGWPRNISHRNFPTSTLCIYKNHAYTGVFFIVAETKGFPCTAQVCRLRGNRNDLPALAFGKSTCCRTGNLRLRCVRTVSFHWE